MFDLTLLESDLKMKEEGKKKAFEGVFFLEFRG